MSDNDSRIEPTFTQAILNEANAIRRFYTDISKQIEYAEYKLMDKVKECYAYILTNADDLVEAHYEYTEGYLAGYPDPIRAIIAFRNSANFELLSHDEQDMFEDRYDELYRALQLLQNLRGQAFPHMPDGDVVRMPNKEGALPS